jgi:hypothetical protein
MLCGMTTSWKEALCEGAVAGSLASVLSAAFLTWRGQVRGEPAAPLNAVSHWFFGDRALREDDASVPFTLAGYVTHHGASVFWGTLHAKALAGRPEARETLPAVAGAVAASAVACFVDYQLTPKRLTPGFEHRLNRAELAGVYACFAVGLAVGGMVMRRRAVKRAAGEPLFGSEPNFPGSPRNAQTSREIGI